MPTSFFSAFKQKVEMKTSLEPTESLRQTRWFCVDGHYVDLKLINQPPPGKNGFRQVGPRVLAQPEGSEELFVSWLTSWATIEEALAWLYVRNPMTRDEFYRLVMPIVVTDLERINWSC